MTTGSSAYSRLKKPPLSGITRIIMSYDEETIIYRVFIELLKSDPKTEQVKSLGEIRSMYRLLKALLKREPTFRELFNSTTQQTRFPLRLALPQQKTATLKDLKEQRGN
jgi:hypothetical protein